MGCMPSRDKTTPLGSNIRRLREQARLTQVELARAAGVHPMTISRLERGARRLSDAVTIAAIARALGCAPGDLLEPMGQLPVEDAVRLLLESGLTGMLSPPLSEQELAWLRTEIPGSFWVGAPPTPAMLVLLIQAYRQRKK